MKGRFALLAAAGSVVGALALAPVGSGAGTAVVKVKCSAKYTSLTPGKLKGEDVGMPSCGAPYGKGIQWIVYTETLSATGTVSAHGTYKAWFDLGTVRGTYKMAGKLKGATATLKGTNTVLGGTGAYHGAKGTGTLSCTTKDAGATFSCTFALRLTRL